MSKKKNIKSPAVPSAGGKKWLWIALAVACALALAFIRIKTKGGRGQHE